VLQTATCIALAWVHATAALAAMTTATVETASDRVSPALCVVNYAIERTNPGTGQVDRSSGSTLGLIVSPGGLVMVRGHMQIENVHPFNVRVRVGEGDDEREYPATVLRKPDDVNVLFLQIEPESPRTFPHVTFARDVTMGLGQPLMVFGILGDTFDNARGVQGRFVGTILDTPRRYYGIDAPVPNGFIGGPCLDANGRVIGVIGYDLTREQGGDLYTRAGYPLVYQSNLFTKYIDNPPGEGAITDSPEDAWLGVFTQPLTDDLARYWDLPAEGGIVISTMVENSPAQVAGLQRGDVVTRFHNTPVRARQDRDVLGFTQLVRQAGVGTEAEVEILRDGEPMTLTVTLVPRPTAAADALEHEDEVFGLTVRELTTDVRIMLNIGADVEGVIVRRVRRGSWADLAQMQPGAIILEFGGIPVTSIQDFEAAVERAVAEQPSEVAVFCRVGQRTGFFRLQPRWPAE
jgi:serine protease Do